MRKQTFFVNSMASIVQAIVLGLIPLFLYRYLIEVIGADNLGLWALILSTTSITRIGELGLSASVVKFVAKYVGLEQLDTATELIQTAIVSLGAIITVIVIIAYPIAKLILQEVVPFDKLEDANQMLPIALISLFFLVITGAIQSGLNGAQRIDISSYITIGSTVFYFFLCLLLAPRFQLMGLAYAQLIQSVTITVISWGFLRKIFPQLPFIPNRWRLSLFREMFSYGVNFQVASLANLLYEPTTMALLSRFGGLSMVAYYQLAKKLVTQVRMLILAGNRAIIPIVAEKMEQQLEVVQKIYIQSQQVIIFISIPSYTILVALSPLIAFILLGEYQNYFVIFTLLLASGWFINTLSAPAYFMYMGLGKLRWNTTANIIIAVLNGMFGFGLGTTFGGIGVVLGWVLSLIISGVFLIITYLQTNHISWVKLDLSSNFPLLISSLLAVAFDLYVFYYFLTDYPFILQTGMMVLVFAGFVFIPFWFHPVRRRLQQWVFANIVQLRLAK